MKTIRFIANISCNRNISESNMTAEEFLACLSYLIPKHLPLTIAVLVIMIGSVLLNPAVIILLTCKGKCKTVFDDILTSHAVINFLAGSVDLFFYLIAWLFSAWNFGKYTCVFWLALDNMLATSEIIHVLYLGWVRVRCVLKPKSYTKDLMVKHSTWVLVSAWLAPLALWLVPIVKQIDSTFGDQTCEILLIPSVLSAVVVFVSFIAPLVLIAVSTVFIVIKLNASENRLARGRSTQPRRNSSLRRRSSSQRGFHVHFQTQRKLSVIISVFLLQYSPYSIMWFVDILCSDCVPSLLYTALLLMTFTPGLTNPLLIIVLNFKHLREGRLNRLN
jgi:hypothetical protein